MCPFANTPSANQLVPLLAGLDIHMENGFSQNLFFFLSKRSNRVTLSMSIVAKASPTNSGGREAHTPQYETISGLYNMHLNCPNLGHIDFVLWTHSKFPRIWGQALCTHSPPWARSDHQPRPLCFEPVGVSDWNSSPHPG